MIVESAEVEVLDVGSSVDLVFPVRGLLTL